jgi:hypothetical protein
MEELTADDEEEETDELDETDETEESDEEAVLVEETSPEVSEEALSDELLSGTEEAGELPPVLAQETMRARMPATSQ